MKHTKGPWIKNSHWTNECNGTRIEGLEITDTDGNIICLTWDSEFPEETDEANAQLIAAAPELLEALKRVLDNLNEPDKIICIAERAIAKAEGKLNNDMDKY